MLFRSGADGLGENDAILLVDAQAKDYRLIASGRFYDRIAAQPSSFVDSCLYDYVQRGDYDGGVTNLLGQLHLLMSDGGYQEDAFFTGGLGVFSLISSLVPVILLIIVLVVLFNIIDGIRYSSWYGRYGTMPVPPVVYRPIFWWHRPGSAWYRMRRNPPPPPPPGRPGGRPGSIFPPPYSPNPPRPSAPKYSPPPRTGGGGFGRGGGFRNSSSGGGGFHSRGGGFRGSPRSGGGGFRGGRR